MARNISVIGKDVQVLAILRVKNAPPHLDFPCAHAYFFLKNGGREDRKAGREKFEERFDVLLRYWRGWGWWERLQRRG